jgi:hypothetical protein
VRTILGRLERNWEKLQLEHPWIWGMVMGLLFALAFALSSVVIDDGLPFSRLILMGLYTVAVGTLLFGGLRSWSNRKHGKE